jgi:hypothetical protein
VTVASGEHRIVGGDLGGLPSSRLRLAERPGQPVDEAELASQIDLGAISASDLELLKELLTCIEATTRPGQSEEELGEVFFECAAAGEDRAGRGQ